MKRLGNGPYASGYLGKHDDALAASPPFTTAKGDPLFDAAMGQRLFQDRAVKPLGRMLARPEPLPTPGAGSSLTATGGGGTGHRHGAGTAGRWGQR